MAEHYSRTFRADPPCQRAWTGCRSVTYIFSLGLESFDQCNSGLDDVSFDVGKRSPLSALAFSKLRTTLFLGFQLSGH